MLAQAKNSKSYAQIPRIQISVCQLMVRTTSRTSRILICSVPRWPSSTWKSCLSALTYKMIANIASDLLHLLQHWPALTYTSDRKHWFVTTHQTDPLVLKTSTIWMLRMSSSLVSCLPPTTMPGTSSPRLVTTMCCALFCTEALLQQSLYSSSVSMTFHLLVGLRAALIMILTKSTYFVLKLAEIK